MTINYQGYFEYQHYHDFYRVSNGIKEYQGVSGVSGVSMAYEGTFKRHVYDILATYYGHVRAMTYKVYIKIIR